MSTSINFTTRQSSTGRAGVAGKQTHLANALAMAYTNKGAALQTLQQLPEALAEYDKAIAILERLVNREQQTDLANQQ